jgi:hypothetical protein
LKTLNEEITDAIDAFRSGDLKALRGYIGAFLAPWREFLNLEQIAAVRDNVEEVVMKKILLAEHTPRIALQLKAIVANQAKTAISADRRRLKTVPLEDLKPDEHPKSESVEEIYERGEDIKDRKNKLLLQMRALSILRATRPRDFEILTAPWAQKRALTSAPALSAAATRTRRKRARERLRAIVNELGSRAS